MLQNHVKQINDCVAVSEMMKNNPAKNTMLKKSSVHDDHDDHCYAPECSGRLVKKTLSLYNFACVPRVVLLFTVLPPP